MNLIKTGARIFRARSAAKTDQNIDKHASSGLEMVLLVAFRLDQGDHTLIDAWLGLLDSKHARISIKGSSYQNSLKSVKLLHKKVEKERLSQIENKHSGNSSYQE
jgi:hypothetical protein